MPGKYGMESLDTSEIPGYSITERIYIIRKHVCGQGFPTQIKFKATLVIVGQKNILTKTIYFENIEDLFL